MIFPTRVELVTSSLIHVPTPLFTLLGEQIRTGSLLKFYFRSGLTLRWSLLEANETTYERGNHDGKESCKPTFMVAHGGEVLRLTRDHLVFALGEWRLWEKFYLPPFGLEGKTVLDVGAGSGESAHLFFRHGAQQVIAIEPSQIACRLLEENAKRNHWNLEIVNREFKLEDLTRTHDFMKMDGEGCEADLLKMKHNILKPCVIEAHSSSLVKDLQAKFNMQIIHTSPNGLSLLASTTSVSGD